MWRILIFCYCYSIIKSYIFSWTFLITCKLNNVSCLYNLINYDVSKCSAEAEVESKVDLTNIFKKFSVDPPFVLVNYYCCITTSPKTQWLKTNIFIVHEDLLPRWCLHLPLSSCGAFGSHSLTRGCLIFQSFSKCSCPGK